MYYQHTLSKWKRYFSLRSKIDKKMRDYWDFYFVFYLLFFISIFFWHRYSTVSWQSYRIIVKSPNFIGKKISKIFCCRFIMQDCLLTWTLFYIVDFMLKQTFTHIFCLFFSFSVLLSSGIELSSKASIVDPVDFISNYDPDGFTKKTSSLFIGRNNTEIWAHAGSNVVFDCLVGRPDLKKHAPVSTIWCFFMIFLKV